MNFYTIKFILIHISKCLGVCAIHLLFLILGLSLMLELHLFFFLDILIVSKDTSYLIWFTTLFSYLKMSSFMKTSFLIVIFTLIFLLTLLDILFNLVNLVLFLLLPILSLLLVLIFSIYSTIPTLKILQITSFTWLSA